MEGKDLFKKFTVIILNISIIRLIKKKKRRKNIVDNYIRNMG